MATVKIGHAAYAHDYEGGNRAQDVLIQDYFENQSQPWLYVLRPKTREIAKFSANICEAVCNNNYIRYSQSSRNSLKSTVIAIANTTRADKDKLEDKYENLYKIETSVITSIVKNINTYCYVDCSSFMTFCALAAHAKIKYGRYSNDNANTVSSMEECFKGAYDVIQAREFTSTGGKKLIRGDILVRRGVDTEGNSYGHTVMVLGTGAKITAATWPYDDADPATASILDITTTKILLALTELKSNELKASIKISKIEYKEEAANEIDLEDKTLLDAYNWYYKIESLEKIGKKIFSDKQNLKIKAASSKFSIGGLVPNHYYQLSVIAVEKEGEVELRSSMVMFKTPQEYPTAVSKLTVDFMEIKPNIGTFYMSFDAPSTWGNPYLQKCYRLNLIVNGSCIDFNDNILNAGGSYSNGVTLKTSSIISGDNIFTYNDTIQIGVQPGMLDAEGSFVCLPSELRCSEPVHFNNHLTLLDKVYVKDKNIFKRAIIHNK